MGQKYTRAHWDVMGVGEKGTPLRSNYQVMLTFTHTPLEGQDREVEHEALIVKNLGDPIIAGREWHNKAGIMTSADMDPKKRFVASKVLKCKQQGLTQEDYEQWKQKQEEEALKALIRSTKAYRATMSYQPKDNLEGENRKTVDALFQGDSSPAGRR